MIVLRRLALAALALERAHAFGDVRELNDEIFDSVVDGSAHVLVEFYKPDCGHRQTMEPEFYKTAEALEFESDVILARVDTEESPKVGKRFAIDGHPIFRCGRMANTFLKMIGERTGSEYPKLDIEVSKAGAPADATPVRYEGADDEVERFVEFVNKETGLDLDPWRRRQKVEIGREEAGGRRRRGRTAHEIARIAKLLKDTSLSSAKRKDFSARKNILNAFAVAATAAKAHGGEL
ncbi:thioredoxin domain-containing protein [Aureococcus anophagefferens]|uniref:protein disulfide-isomerase n=1 Tax=Aureococcus anophagefferens TaxID=44056 RepID=A0ABR1FG20_AURAN